jgi:hypothetical protein
MKTYNEPVDKNVEKQNIENEKKLAIEEIDVEKPLFIDRSKTFYYAFLFGIIFIIALLLAILL